MRFGDKSALTGQENRCIKITTLNIKINQIWQQRILCRLGIDATCSKNFCKTDPTESQDTTWCRHEQQQGRFKLGQLPATLHCHEGRKFRIIMWILGLGSLKSTCYYWSLFTERLLQQAMKQMDKFFHSLVLNTKHLVLKVHVEHRKDLPWFNPQFSKKTRIVRRCCMINTRVFILSSVYYWKLVYLETAVKRDMKAYNIWKSTFWTRIKKAKARVSSWYTAGRTLWWSTLALTLLPLLR